MEDLADGIESEMSSIDDRNDLCSVGSFGSAGSSNRRRLQGFRSKHAKCLQALRKKAEGGVPSDLSLKMAPADRMRLAVGKQMLQAQAVSALTGNRQVTASDSEELLDRAADRFEADARKVLGEQIKAWEDAANDLRGIGEALWLQKGGIESLHPQDTKPQVAELRSVISSQGQELEQLRLQETHVVVRYLKDSVETLSKLGAQRIDERQGAIDRLKEAIIAQSKDFEGLKLMGSDFKGIQQRITTQAQRLNKLQPAVRELRDELFRARAAVAARGGALESLTRQLQDQRQDHLNEVQRLRVALRVQDERSAGLRAEIAAIRQRESAAAQSDSSFGAGVNMKGDGSHSDVTDKSCERSRQGRKAGGLQRKEAMQLAVAGFLGAMLPLLVSGIPRKDNMAFSTEEKRSLLPSWLGFGRNSMPSAALLPGVAPVSRSAASRPPQLRLRRRRR